MVEKTLVICTQGQAQGQAVTLVTACDDTATAALALCNNMIGQFVLRIRDQDSFAILTLMFNVP